MSLPLSLFMGVAPLAGAWIEMPHPLSVALEIAVAPLAGAWIEMPSIAARFTPARCRPPRGGVD